MFRSLIPCFLTFSFLSPLFLSLSLSLSFSLSLNSLARQDHSLHLPPSLRLIPPTFRSYQFALAPSLIPSLNTPSERPSQPLPSLSTRAPLLPSPIPVPSSAIALPHHCYYATILHSLSNFLNKSFFLFFLSLFRRPNLITGLSG